MSPVKIAIEALDSKAALLSALSKAGPNQLLVGENSEAPRSFYYFECQFEGRRLGVGVISSGLGTLPAGLLMDHGRTILVGSDCSLTSIDVARAVSQATCALGGVFFEFLMLATDEEVVVVHELGALRVDAKCCVRWSVSTDILESAQVSAEGTLVLAEMDSERAMTLSLSTGEPL